MKPQNKYKNRLSEIHEFRVEWQIDILAKKFPAAAEGRWPSSATPTRPPPCLLSLVHARASPALWIRSTTPLRQP
jgi:hypothetical protein